VRPVQAPLIPEGSHVAALYYALRRTLEKTVMGGRPLGRYLRVFNHVGFGTGAFNSKHSTAGFISAIV
jgi:hypothetical protein